MDQQTNGRTNEDNNYGPHRVNLGIKYIFLTNKYSYSFQGNFHQRLENSNDFLKDINKEWA